MSGRRAARAARRKGTPDTPVGVAHRGAHPPPARRRPLSALASRPAGKGHALTSKPRAPGGGSAHLPAATAASLYDPARPVRRSRRRPGPPCRRPAGRERQRPGAEGQRVPLNTSRHAAPCRIPRPCGWERVSGCRPRRPRDRARTDGRSGDRRGRARRLLRPRRGRRPRGTDGPRTEPTARPPAPPPRRSGNRPARTAPEHGSNGAPPAPRWRRGGRRTWPGRPLRIHTTDRAHREVVAR